MTGVFRVILRPAFDRHGARSRGDSSSGWIADESRVSRAPLAAFAGLLAGADPRPRRSPAIPALKVGPRFTRWKAFSRSDVDAPVRFGDRSVPDTGKSAERIHDSNVGGLTSAIRQPRAARPVSAGPIEWPEASPSASPRCARVPTLQLQHRNGQPRWNLSDGRPSPPRWRRTHRSATRTSYRPTALCFPTARPNVEIYR